MTSESPEGATDRFELLMAIDMDIGAFASDWAYCDRLSTYVAKMISHNRTDSLLYSNLLSSALNELLETVHRAHGPSGHFTCMVLRRGGKDRIELTIPNAATEIDFYHRAITCISRDDLPDRYRAALFHDGPIDPAIGLMELVVDYNARLTVEPMDEEVVRLTAELTLEDAPA